MLQYPALLDVTISYTKTTFRSYSDYYIPVHSPYIWFETEHIQTLLTSA